MKKVLLLALILAFAGALIGTLPVAADSYPKTLVDVTYNIYNDEDSAVWGGNWAVDNLNEELIVTQISPTQCQFVQTFNGTFVTMAGKSPQNTGIIGAGITGTVVGSYTSSAPFDCTPNPSPSYSTTGYLGSFNRSDSYPSFMSYFTSPADYPAYSWNFTYTTCSSTGKQIWVNADTGDLGDITGNDGGVCSSPAAPYTAPDPVWLQMWICSVNSLCFNIGINPGPDGGCFVYDLSGDIIPTDTARTLCFADPNFTLKSVYSGWVTLPAPGTKQCWGDSIYADKCNHAGDIILAKINKQYGWHLAYKWFFKGFGGH